MHSLARCQLRTSTVLHVLQKKLEWSRNALAWIVLWSFAGVAVMSYCARRFVRTLKQIKWKGHQAETVKHTTS